ncbi:MAG: DsrE family protein [Armatimonadota bacterium]|nr:DsrE family protein [bacterium]MDW8289621.1 DsrE family protein [Armatimonadota bacterium]
MPRLALGVLLLIALGFVYLHAQTTSRDSTLFVNLTSDDAWRAEMALHYAQQAQRLGYRVVLFLNVRGVYVARKNPPASLRQAQANLQQMIRAGATVYVCPMCSRRAGMRVPDDWIEGVKAGSEEVIHLQMGANTRVMSY